MLDIKRIKEDPQAVKDGLKAKEGDCDAIVDRILELDVQIRGLKTSTESKTGADDGTKVTTSDTGARADIVNCTRVSFTDKDTGETVIYEPNKASAVAGQNTFDLPRPMQLSNSTRLFKLTALTPKQVTVRIWIEGEDPQCDDDVQLANLQVQLNFEGTDDNNVPLN